MKPDFLTFSLFKQNQSQNSGFTEAAEFLEVLLGAADVARGVTIVVGLFHDIQMAFECFVETAVANGHITIEMGHTDSQCLKQGAGNALDEVLAGVTLIVFFDMDGAIEIHER